MGIKFPNLEIGADFFAKYKVFETNAANCCRCDENEKNEGIWCVNCKKSFLCYKCITKTDNPIRSILQSQYLNDDRKIALACCLTCFDPLKLRYEGFVTCIVHSIAGLNVKFLYHLKSGPFVYPSPVVQQKSYSRKKKQEESHNEEIYVVDSLVDQELIPDFTKELKKYHPSCQILENQVIIEIMKHVIGPSKDGHYHVSESIYIPYVRAILNKLNPTCIYASSGCQYTKRLGLLKPRFYCQNKSCGLIALLVIRVSDGNIDAFFSIKGSANEDNSEVISITHKRGDKAQIHRIRKQEKKMIQKELVGKTPSQYFLEKKLLLTDEEIRAGKNSLGKRTIQKTKQAIRIEAYEDKDMLVSLNSIAKAATYLQIYDVSPHARFFCYIKKHIKLIAELGHAFDIGIDGTGGLLSHKFNDKTLELYRIIVKNPQLKEQPVCLYEGFCSKQTLEELVQLISGFNNAAKAAKKDFRPRRVISDYSFPIIIASLMCFNDESLSTYLARMFKIATGEITMSDEKTILCICRFHYFQAIKRNLVKIFKGDKDSIRFYKTLCFILSSTRSWSEFRVHMGCFIVIGSSKHNTAEVSRAKSQILSSLRTINEINAEFDAEIHEPSEQNEQLEVEGGGEKNCLISSMFYKDIILLKSEKILTLNGETELTEPNPLYSPKFLDYYILHWASVPIFSSIFDDYFKTMINSNPAKYTGIRSSLHIDKTNNCSELANKLLKDHLGKKKLRLDEVIKRAELYSNAIFKHLRQNMMFSYDKIVKQKKRKAVCPTEKPEVWGKKKNE